MRHAGWQSPREQLCPATLGISGTAARAGDNRSAESFRVTANSERTVMPEENVCERCGQSLKSHESISVANVGLRCGEERRGGGDRLGRAGGLSNAQHQRMGPSWNMFTKYAMFTML